jgi:hypothetical protein
MNAASIAGFGPPPDDELEHHAGTDSPLPGDEPQDLIDPDDPRLTTEIQDVNVNANAYAVPVPIPDGKYRVRLKLEKQKVGTEEKDFIPKPHEKNGPYYACSISATVIAPDKPMFDGAVIYDPWVSTFRQKGGGTKIQTILMLLTNPLGKPYITDGTKMNQRGWIDTFIKALAGEPELVAETIWEWNCQKCAEEAKAKKESRPNSVKGMYKFPPSKTVRGQFDPELKCEVNKAHGYSRARPRISQLLPLSSLPKS